MRNAHSNEFEKPIPVYQSKDTIEPKQIDQRGLRAEMPFLYNDVMTEDGLMMVTNEQIIGCYKITKTDHGLGMLYIGSNDK